MESFDTLCISGGGIKGIYYLGALDNLLTRKAINLQSINTYIGSSVGALICFCLILGVKPFPLLLKLIYSRFLLKFNLSSSEWSNNFPKSVFEFEVILNFLEELLNKVEPAALSLTFKELHEKTGKHFIVSTYNISHYEMEYLSSKTTPSLKCITALQMSCSIPLIFPPVKVNDIFYADPIIVGGMPNVEVIDSASQRALVLYNSFKIEEELKEGFFSYFKFLFWSISNFNLKKRIGALDKKHFQLHIRGEVLGIKFSCSSKELMNMFEDGYRQAAKCII